MKLFILVAANVNDWLQFTAISKHEKKIHRSSITDICNTKNTQYQVVQRLFPDSNLGPSDSKAERSLLSAVSKGKSKQVN